MPDNNKLIESVFEKGTLTIRLFGRIDSTNAAAAEEEILAAAQEHAGSPVVLDMKNWPISPVRDFVCCCI